uniref:Uncharacterized protein n=1 Tax=Leersia perrieri TaxID=77586 RepID=A0A0D9X6E8_9ORYZ
MLIVGLNSNFKFEKRGQICKLKKARLNLQLDSCPYYLCSLQIPLVASSCHLPMQGTASNMSFQANCERYTGDFIYDSQISIFLSWVMDLWMSCPIVQPLNHNKVFVKTMFLPHAMTLFFCNV